MSIQTRLLIYLAVLGIVDIIIPVPLTALALIYVLFQKPVGFKQWVDEIYRS